MPLNLASPGIVVREVDLTIGRVDPVSGSIGALVAPFAKGPVGLPQLIESEDDLYQTYGKPYNTDKQYESWLVASSYLAYGGTMQVVRADDTGLKNASDNATPALTIKSDDHYNQLGYDDNTISSTVVAAQNPGTWANGIRIGVCDAKADQELLAVVGVNTVGYAVTQTMVGKALIGAGTTSQADGYLKGIVTEINSTTVGVKVLSHVTNAGVESDVDYQPTGTYAFNNTGSITATPTGVAIGHASGFAT